ncbi:MAG: DUF87 domain-containing protein [Ignisphaera sp.]
MSSGISKFYMEGEKEAFTTHFSEDLVIRSPIFMNLPEPSVEVLWRPLAKYGIYIGTTDICKVPWHWDPSLIQNPLIAIIGMPGAGKSETVKTLILRLKEKDIDAPVIVVDPEGEYYAVVKQLGEGVVLNIGTEHYINVFDRPAWNFNYQLWVRKAVIPGILKALKISHAQAPLMMRVLEKAIFDVYEKVYRFDPLNKETWKQQDPTLLDVVRQIESDVKPYLEGRVSKQPPLFRTKMALLERLKRWVEGEGTDFFAHPSTIKLSDLLNQPIVVFNIKTLPSDARDMFTFYIFNYFYALMEMLPPLPSFKIRLVLVFDEGWILLKSERGEESPLAPLFRRARKYGFASIIATQHYKDVSADILPLVGTVILLRIRDADAVKKLAETLKIPNRLANQIPTLPTGKALVSIAWRRTDFQNANIPFLVNVETAMQPQVTLIMYKKAGAEDVFRSLRSQMARTG